MGPLLPHPIRVGDNMVMAQDDRKEACKNIQYFPFELDGPLWELNYCGCSRRQNGKSCPQCNECRNSLGVDEYVDDVYNQNN